MTSIEAVLAEDAVYSVFQPIINLDTGAVVAYEALARGPEGPLHTPDRLFSAARASNLLGALDAACRAAAFRGAIAQNLLAPLTVFVNVEPEVLDAAPVEDLLALADGAPGHLRIVMEITERALATRPAELLRTVQRVRSLGWGIALDDIGADPASLAFMPLLRPDVLKLDLSLVQRRASPAIAEIMNAVNAHAERTGALVLAEGIETPDHLTVARGLGATLGQGWLFGRPQEGHNPQLEVGELLLPTLPSAQRDSVSPFACLPPGAVLRRSPKRLLVELSKHLEREAIRLGRTCVVASTFQEAQHFTPLTRTRYQNLVDSVGFVAALGEDLPEEPIPGVRGATLAADDPMRGEWDVVVVSPHFATALLARDLGDDGPDMDRMFEYALTYDRDCVVDAANALLSRVLPAGSPTTIDARLVSAGVAATAPARVPDAVGSVELPPLSRALAATTSGITIVDMQQPGQPLVFVNEAFEQLSGLPAEDLLHRNCRSLQGPDTDPSTVQRIRAAIARGVACQETLLNYRGPTRTPWWNELNLTPVLDDAGVLRHYIGIQNDVTARVTIEQSLREERERNRKYLARIEQLAYIDSLTGLLNRRRFEDRVETHLWEAQVNDSALALLFMDLDGFKEVNDSLGHSAGDDLLRQVADRLRARLRRHDLAARWGGDEFLVALLGLDKDTAGEEAEAVARQLSAAIAEPYDLGGTSVRITVSVGISIHPHDAGDFGRLQHLADVRMYRTKHPASL